MEHFPVLVARTVIPGGCPGPRDRRGVSRDVPRWWLRLTAPISLDWRRHAAFCVGPHLRGVRGRRARRRGSAPDSPQAVRQGAGAEEVALVAPMLRDAGSRTVGRLRCEGTMGIWAWVALLAASARWRRSGRSSSSPGTVSQTDYDWIYLAGGGLVGGFTGHAWYATDLTFDGLHIVPALVGLVVGAALAELVYRLVLVPAGADPAAFARIALPSARHDRSAGRPAGSEISLFPEVAMTVRPLRKRRPRRRQGRHSCWAGPLLRPWHEHSGATPAGHIQHARRRARAKGPVRRDPGGRSPRRPTRSIRGSSGSASGGPASTAPDLFDNVGKPSARAACRLPGRARSATRSRWRSR